MNVKEDFVCTNQSQCVSDSQAGTCEANGFCAFPDATCASGRRFAEHSGIPSGSCVTGSTSGRWLEGYGSRKLLTLKTTSTETDLQDTPLAVSLVDPDLFGVGYPDGRDIAFTTEDGSQLPHEIEFFDKESGSLVAWVNVPNIVARSATEIYVYFGNAAAPDQQNPGGTWPADRYRGVWHLSQDQTSAAAALLDSTMRGNHGTPANGVSSTEGVVGRALTFDGVNDAVNIKDNNQAHVFGLTSFSASLWVKLPQLMDQGNTMLMRYDPATTDTTGWIFEVSESSMGHRWAAIVNEGVGGAHWAYGPAVEVNQWIHLVMVVDRPAQKFAIFFQGALASERTLPDGALDATNDIVLSPGGNRLLGSLDELRLHSGVLSADRIKLDYDNISLGSAFTVTGPLESRP